MDCSGMHEPRGLVEPGQARGKGALRLSNNEYYPESVFNTLSVGL